MICKDCFNRLSYIIPIDNNSQFEAVEINGKYEIIKYYKHCSMRSTVYFFSGDIIFDAVDSFDNLTQAVKFLKSNFSNLI